MRRVASNVLRPLLEIMDARTDWLPLHPSFYRCPADGCTTEDHGIFVCVIRGPDRRQRAVWACPEHLAKEVEASINHLRLKPPPDL